ncbi:hypothetical protein HC028_15310 [Planosporangium flavigriseum]|uniref:Uncharacterized protein n=1 Tax=Planosporangium flavigriseum TaxID=373681 RepID=A0A8J3M3C9_9ACTN|nr:hypothetical protein [Planosporangium flavigriseum]NJC65858.1 hypothetical protein [Planosporangium flavigriseum]GIG76095.1 hypothetical protein Pfl04_44990 [Planosporangium flavigriseum]
MTAWTRWRIAVPLVALSALSLAAALAGAVAWWSISGAASRAVTVAISLILAANLAVSVSIGIVRIRETPWLRIGIVVLGFLVSCGLCALR